MKNILYILTILALVLTGCTAPAESPTAPPTAAPLETSAPTPVPTHTAPVAEATATPTTPPGSSLVAYIGRDGNLWLVDPIRLERQQLTTDAASYSGNNSNGVIFYQNPAWSSDGRYLAYQRETGTVSQDGWSYSDDVLVIDFKTMQTRVILEGIRVIGFAWQPATHLIAYAKTADPNYFTARGQVDSTLATGILWQDVDSGEGGELVQPEAGYALADPRWSPNGQIISFYELIYMEGRGPFAYYDFASRQYVRWEEAIGSVDWSPDGSQLLYDTLNYTPSYSERIFLINRDRSGLRQLSPDGAERYAYNPLFSPQGDRLAYLDIQGMDPNNIITLMVLDLPAGTPRPLAVLTQAYGLSWTPDGQNLLVALGNPPETELLLIAAADGSTTRLAEGWQAVMQPQP